MSNCKCECRQKHRGDDEKKSLINRTSRIEGQIRGIKRMIEEDAYCPDIIIQISAAASALSALSRAMLTEHINTCVLSDIRAGRDGAAEELSKLLEGLMK